MNKELLQKCINRLNEIKNGFQIDIYNGICCNLLYRTYDEKCFVELGNYSITNRWLSAQFSKWPECYGFASDNKDIKYPVGGWEEYWDDNLLWENPKRLRLLDFLIEQATMQFKEMDKE